ncbi:MAG: TolC family protein [Planctomycetota bacterium]
MLAACATVRHAREVQDPSSAIPGERTPTAAELGLPTSGPVSLEELLRIALTVHPDVVGTQRDVDSARARVRQVEGALLPQVSASASISFTDQGTPEFSRNQRFESLGFDVSWLLFDFGETRATASAAGEQWLAAQADFASARVDVAFALRSAYFDLATRVQLLAVAEETVRQFEVRYEQVQAFVEVGTRIPYDETKAEVDLGNARLIEVQTRDSVLEAQATLVNAVGLAEVADWMADADAPLPELPDDFDSAWALAREHRPTLASAAARERAASALVDARIAALYPSFDLGLGGSTNDVDFSSLWFWQIGANARWTPFNGFQNLATIDEAVAGLRAARASCAVLEQQAWLDTRSAWVALENARHRIDLTVLTEKSAEQNLELAAGLFEVGKATSIELTDAQQLLARARAERVQARADYQAAASRLARALGIAEK